MAAQQTSPNPSPVNLDTLNETDRRAFLSLSARIRLHETTLRLVKDTPRNAKRRGDAAAMLVADRARLAQMFPNL